MPHVLNIGDFRQMFPAFSDPAKFPDATISLYWDMAQSYITAEDGPLLCGPPLQTALYLMTAHLLVIMLNAGSKPAGQGGVTTSKTVDKVSYTNAPPPYKNGWQFWLSQSPYGQQLWALLRLKSAGGWYFGGSPERRAFRKSGGRF